jgi:hypothetical protein
MNNSNVGLIKFELERLALNVAFNSAYGPVRFEVCRAGALPQMVIFFEEKCLMVGRIQRLTPASQRKLSATLSPESIAWQHRTHSSCKGCT